LERLFLTLHPTQYAKVFERKIRQHNSKIYLVNTGWNGRGERISLLKTRRIIKAINNNLIDLKRLNALPIFNLGIPRSLFNEDAEFFDPRLSFESAGEWEQKALILADKFNKNFNRFLEFESKLAEKYSNHGPIKTKINTQI
jgi:phosphoenolpyruvate carboxykinase (ATP)